MNSVTIVGLGAIGSVYASAMADSGITVRVAADEARCARNRTTGLLFNGTRYDFDYYTPCMADPVADLVIIAVKSGGLGAALDLIEPIVGQHTQILPLLNGITSEQICAARYGWNRVIYGYFIGHTATRNENVVNQDGQYRTYFGERINDTISPRIAALQSLFDRASIPYKTPRDMVDALWQKFIINIGMNQATAVLKCTYGHLQNSTAANDLMVVLMKEAAAVGTAQGIVDTDKMVEKAQSLLRGLTPEDGSSMYQDVMSGRATEIDIFADTVCELALKSGIQTPYNYYVSVIIKAFLQK